MEQTEFVQNVAPDSEEEPTSNEPPARHAPLPILTLNGLMTPARGRRYSYADTQKGIAGGPDDYGRADESSPRRGGGADPLKLLPQRTAQERAADREDVLGGSRPVGMYSGDRVAAGGPWAREGGDNGIDMSQGAGDGTVSAPGFVEPISTEAWNDLLRNKVFQRRQRRNSGSLDTATSPSNDPNNHR